MADGSIFRLTNPEIYVVTTAQDCYMLLKRGEKARITRSTLQNIASSRSHSIFQILMERDELVSKKGVL